MKLQNYVLGKPNFIEKDGISKNIVENSNK